MSRPSERAAVILSFDVEEHDRIEAAVGVECPPELKATYATRMEAATRGLLAQLAAAGTPATFFVVGQIAESHPQLVRAIADAGHEVGSHGWDHKRVHRFTPETFREDVRRSKAALEQATGRPVVGYRAPTFSVVRQTAWAIDVLAAAGLRYDSSIYPVRHDRYGVPDAPRTPFVAVGRDARILELPPATYRVMGQNLPVGGGGYFRLFPPAVMRAGIRQLGRAAPAVGMLYFHPWEFDPGQPRLPLSRLSRWRTYVGVGKSTARLDRLLANYAGRFRRAIDVVADLEPKAAGLPQFQVDPPSQ
ncbi:XrtA system polysaccharide deacetylase [Fimbriiglobus ruber]|uniref:Polysaccharide deacetylase n=1 Tax=Fimbriiglobus ruber TaxID=1908690 RepID=A0A225EBH4_9BACT|nr:XrtA system polysaccharide deacetylase [Fimbriiglobus ruber]OWK47366.1 Polysaccharide deacetylase [Fimbriiglobus ruber]